MDSAACDAIRPPRKRNEKGRRCWSQREEEVLIAGLKEIIATGWKSENGFRVGYLQALETYMGKEFPGSDIKGTPHINSKIHAWKKTYGSLFSMLSSSGVGWNDSTKMIEASDEAWADYIKVDSHARLMRFKSFPMYEDWCEVFGKDRATGRGAEGFSDAANVTVELDNDNDVFDNYSKLFEELDATAETMSVSQPQPSQSTAGKKSSSRKRKSADLQEQPICDILSRFCENTDSRLGDIAKRIGYEHDISAARKEVWAVVSKFEGLTMREKLLAAKLIVKETEDIELFFTLPDIEREEFARLKLAGQL